MEIYCSKAHFQKNLRLIVQILGMNYRQFGDLIGVTRQAVGVWARQECEMPKYTFLAYKYCFIKMNLDRDKRDLLRHIYNLETMEEDQ